MFGAIGNFIASVASTVADVVETVVDAVVDTVEDVVDVVIDTTQNVVQAGQDALCSVGGVVGDILCGIGNIVGGIVNGLLYNVQDFVHDVFNLVRDVVDIGSDLLRLDFAGALNHFIELVIDVTDTFLDIGRGITGGYVVGAIVQSFQRDSLRNFVEGLVRDRFGADQNRMTRIRSAIGLSGGTFGFNLPAEHRVFRLDSANVPLWDWHNRGVIDLFAMAGLLSFDSFRVQRPRTVVVRVIGDKDVRFVNRTFLANHIASQGGNGRIRVYAMSREAIAEKLHVATTKCEQLGVRLSWNDGENFSWFRHYTPYDIMSEEEYRFELLARQSPRVPSLDEYLLEKGLKSGEADQECNLLALGAFRYASGVGLFGLTAGRNICEGSGATGCPTPHRTDQCCNTVKHIARGRRDTGGGVCPPLTSGQRLGSGVVHRDVWPDYFFRYVLAHEIGHYLGLCHITHDGFQNIMFQARANSPWSLWLFNYYLDSEPHFTLDDAMNTWRFIVDQMEPCLPGPTPPP